MRLAPNNRTAAQRSNNPFLSLWFIGRQERMSNAPPRAKSEDRRPKSERNPKSEVRTAERLLVFSDFGIRVLDFFRISSFYCVPCAVANSRRVKTATPN